MSVNNVAFNTEDEKASEVIKEMFRACFTKDLVPIKIKEKEYTCILSVSTVDMSILEHLVRKAKCVFEVSTGYVIGTSISINVGVIRS